MSTPISDNLTRFSDRVENYVKYRPSYPSEVISFLQKTLGLQPNWQVADIGSGTGISSELFLKHGNEVFGVEPNYAMRSAAEDFLASYDHFASVKGTAEATTLPDDTIDLIVCAQAFHWFDRETTKKEFKRILKSPGYVALLWNDRLIRGPFLEGYEQLLLTYGTDYEKVAHRNITEQMIEDFFAPYPVHLAAIDNYQEFDYTGLEGRLLSSSYTPSPEDPRYIPMLERLRQLFQEHQVNGKVRFEYKTTIYTGQFK